MTRPFFFKIGEDTISHTDSYTYLGLELTRDGKLNTAARTLAAKGKRAMGSLMGSIDKTIVKPEMSLKLFNSLVKPILLYGSQIWLPLLAPKQVIGLSTPNLATFFNSHAECGGERVHLRFFFYFILFYFFNIFSFLIFSRRIAPRTVHVLSLPLCNLFVLIPFLQDFFKKLAVFVLFFF